MNLSKSLTFVIFLLISTVSFVARAQNLPLYIKGAGVITQSNSIKGNLTSPSNPNTKTNSDSKAINQALNNTAADREALLNANRKSINDCVAPSNKTFAIEVAESEPQIVSVKSVRELTQHSDKYTWLDSSTKTHTLGRYKFNMSIALNVSGINRTSSTGEKCFISHRPMIALTLNPEIEVGRELLNFECSYKAVLKHEMTHHKIHQMALKTYIEELKKFESDWPWISQKNEKQEDLIARLKGYIDVASRKMSEVNQENENFDKAEYGQDPCPKHERALLRSWSN